MVYALMDKYYLILSTYTPLINTKHHTILPTTYKNILLQFIYVYNA